MSSEYFSEEVSNSSSRKLIMISIVILVVIVVLGAIVFLDFGNVRLSPGQGTEDALEIRFPIRGESPEDWPSVKEVEEDDIVEIAVVLDTKSSGIQGWSYGVKHDPEFLEIVVGSVCALECGSFENIFDGGFNIANPSRSDPGWVSSVVLSFREPVKLPANRINVLGRAKYKVLKDVGEDGIKIEFSDELRSFDSSPAIGVILTVDGSSGIPGELVAGRLVRKGTDISNFEDDPETEGDEDLPEDNEEDSGSRTGDTNKRTRERKSVYYSDDVDSDNEKSVTSLNLWERFILWLITLFTGKEKGFDVKECENQELFRVRPELLDVDKDEDGKADFCRDNCPTLYNPDQKDTDFDRVGDICDACDGGENSDRDSYCDDDDPEPFAPRNWVDIRLSGPFVDDDGDTTPDVTQPRLTPRPRLTSPEGNEDADDDGIPDDEDNCPDNSNPSQLDCDDDGEGDACDEHNSACSRDLDSDGDGIAEGDDNCPEISNEGQEDFDNDGIGDACDKFSCGNGEEEENEECDDGNDNDNDACINTCADAICGDGLIQTGVEDCDGGTIECTREDEYLGENNCKDDCTGYDESICFAIESCGDGVVQGAAGEECDDGNFDNGDGCDEFCFDEGSVDGSTGGGPGGGPGGSAGDNNDGTSSCVAGTTTCGIGACERSSTCSSSGQVVCNPGTPANQETCGNGIDDDCDNAVDEECQAEPPPSPPAPTGLVGHWRLDSSGGTQTDSSGEGNDGTVIGATYTSNGRINGAYNFDGDGGTDQYISISDSSSLRVTSGVTLAVWVKPTGFSEDQRVVHKRDTSSKSAYGLYLDNGYVQFRATPCASSVVFDVGGETGSKLTRVGNDWTHIATTFDDASNTVRIYVNGQLSDSAVGNYQGTICGSNSENVEIGGVSNRANRWFSGGIDDVRIYGRALTASEIAGLAGVSDTQNNQPPVCNNDGYCDSGENVDNCPNDCTVEFGCNLVEGTAGYCADPDCGPCGEGEGICDINDDCSGDLVCTSDGICEIDSGEPTPPEPIVVFEDSCNNLGSWTTSSCWRASGTCFCDFDVGTHTLISEAIDLSDAESASLTFDWFVEELDAADNEKLTVSAVSVSGSCRISERLIATSDSYSNLVWESMSIVIPEGSACLANDFRIEVEAVIGQHNAGTEVDNIKVEKMVLTGPAVPVQPSPPLEKSFLARWFEKLFGWVFGGG